MGQSHQRASTSILQGTVSDQKRKKHNFRPSLTPLRQFDEFVMQTPTPLNQPPVQESLERFMTSNRQSMSPKGNLKPHHQISTESFS